MRPSRQHPPLRDLGDPRPSNPYALKHVGKRCPSEARTLAATPIEPFEGTRDGPAVEAVKRARVAAYAVVVVVPPQPSIEATKELASRLVPALQNPFLDPSTRALQFLRRGPPLHPRYPLPVAIPEELETQKGETPLAAGMKPAETQAAGLIRGDLQTEFLQPFRQHSIESLRIFSVTERADKIIGIARHDRLATTMPLDLAFEPQVQGIVQIDIRLDR
jgi:hypothetical protein